MNEKKTAIVNSVKNSRKKFKFRSRKKQKLLPTVSTSYLCMQIDSLHISVCDAEIAHAVVQLPFVRLDVDFCIYVHLPV